MKTASRFIIVTLVLLVVLGGIFGYKFMQMSAMQEQMAQPEPPAPVEATRVQQSEWLPSVDAVGSTRAINGISVANEVAGVVDSLNFESGQSVKKGDVLVRLDTDTDEAALQARQAEADLARLQFERFGNLLPQKAVSQSQYDEAKANYDAARARVIEAEALMNKKVIRAPFDGVVGLRQVDLGEFLAVGSPIVEINMLDPIYVDYTLPEKELSRLAVGDRVEAEVAAYPDREFVGEIQSINSSINPESRTLAVRAKLDNKAQQLRPGMFVRIKSLRREPRQLLSLPREAISYNTYGDYVFLIESAEKGGSLTVKRQQVTTGSVENGRVEIVEGLQAGDRVVATGLVRLRNGQSVKLADSSGRADGSSGQADGSDSADEGAQ